MQRCVQRAPRPHLAARVPLGGAGRGDEDQLRELHQLLADLLCVTLAYGGEKVLGLFWVLVQVPQTLARALLVFAATARREPLQLGAPAFLRVSRLGRELVRDATFAAPVFLRGIRNTLPLRGRCNVAERCRDGESCNP